MKKVFVFLFTCLLSFSLCACQSADERELESLRKNVETAEEAYDRAVQNTKDFQATVDSYQKGLEALK